MGEAVAEATWSRVRNSPGHHKHLVLGNHDLTGSGRVRVEGFDDVWSVMTSGRILPLIWTHCPLRDVPESHVNIHGHEHAAPPRNSRHINVSVEQLHCEPLSLTRLRRLAQALAAGQFRRVGRLLNGLGASKQLPSHRSGRSRATRTWRSAPASTRTTKCLTGRGGAARHIKGLPVAGPDERDSTLPITRSVPSRIRPRIPEWRDRFRRWPAPLDHGSGVADGTDYRYRPKQMAASVLL